MRCSLAQSVARPAAVFVDEFDAGGGDCSTLLSPCSPRLAESNALTGPVLVEEFNTRGLECSLNDFQSRLARLTQACLKLMYRYDSNTCLLR